jgi:hypothetical protein
MTRRGVLALQIGSRRTVGGHIDAEQYATPGRSARPSHTHVGQGGGILFAFWSVMRVEPYSNGGTLLIPDMLEITLPGRRRRPDGRQGCVHTYAK